VTPFGTDWNGCFGLGGKSFFKPEVDGLWLLVNFKALVCLAKVFKTCGYDGLFIEVKKETAPRVLWCLLLIAKIIKTSCWIGQTK